MGVEKRHLDHHRAMGIKDRHPRDRKLADSIGLANKHRHNKKSIKKIYKSARNYKKVWNGKNKLDDLLNKESVFAFKRGFKGGV